MTTRSLIRPTANDDNILFPIPNHPASDSNIFMNGVDNYPNVNPLATISWSVDGGPPKKKNFVGPSDQPHSPPLSQDGMTTCIPSPRIGTYKRCESFTTYIDPPNHHHLVPPYLCPKSDQLTKWLSFYYMWVSIRM